MYAVTFFSVGWGVAAGEEGACTLDDGTPYCGATDADGWKGCAARVGLKASEAPKIATRTKTAFSLYCAKFVVLCLAREWPVELRKRDSLIAVLAPVRNGRGQTEFVAKNAPSKPVGNGPKFTFVTPGSSVRANARPSQMRSG